MLCPLLFSYGNMVMRTLETFNFDVMLKSNRSFHRKVSHLILHFIANQLVHCHERWKFISGYYYCSADNDMKMSGSYALIEHYSMKTHEGVEVKFYALLSSELDGEEWSASHSSRFTLARWSQKPVWMLRKRGISLSLAGIRTSIPRLRSP
jgi:hypothetical protein